MSLSAFEPALAGELEQVFAADGVAALAYPRGRHGRLERERPRLSVLVVVDGPAPALETLPASDGPDVEVIVLDNASAAFPECVAFARGAENRVLYRVPQRLERPQAWALARALARGRETVEGVPETRERALLALGSEVVADPRLLARFREIRGEADDVTLVILATPLDAALLPGAVEQAGLEDADLVAVVSQPGDGSDRRLAAVCSGVLTPRG